MGWSNLSENKLITCLKYVHVSSLKKVTQRKLTEYELIQYFMYFRINMALTNAEKQRRYRERRDMDPSRREEHLKKRNEKYKNDVQVGKLKKISDMTPREQRKQRKEWRKIKQNQRRKKKKREVKALTPPSSPVDISQREHHSTCTTRKKRAIAKCYRDNAKLREE